MERIKSGGGGAGGQFSYYELGPVLLLPDGNLNEEVGAQEIREYVYYMETKEPMPIEHARTSPISWAYAATPPITSITSGKASPRWTTPFIYNPDQGRRLYHLCRSMRYPSGNTAQPQHPI